MMFLFELPLVNVEKEFSSAPKASSERPGFPAGGRDELVLLSAIFSPNY